jgi:hypothetical protein
VRVVTRQTIPSREDVNTRAQLALLALEASVARLL